ncbi:fungal-specific transcription factor domain-containing protein [Aspergillus pseudoustus]|uniref:Fungal-specific transcription factor domain-containing protein n=1 Tax=Aspergillus pseudoustus TaxID=1810923 RepID=A0ABR4JEH0_9EURO
MHTEAAPVYPQSTAEQACRECRRRKSKCDRTIPVCHLCAKFNRGCTYEKSSRTPLTRTHLSQVENELARTKTLLARFMPQGERGEDQPGCRTRRDGMTRSQSEAPSALPGSNGAGADGLLARDYLREDALHPSRPSPAPAPPALDQHHASRIPTAAVSVGQAQAPKSSRAMRPAPEAQSVTPAFSLETPPSSSNFEWDERAGATGGDKFVDGMASLTSRSNEGGYLGSASGAALLRLTDRSSEGENDTAYPSADARRPSIPFALTSMSQLEPFVDAYFRLYHCSYPIVHEATFRAQFMEIIPRPAGSAWQVLLHVISALGVYTSATHPTDIDFALFDAAKERLSINVLETGNLVLVQALTLISNYLQKRNQPNSGYNYMGLARRVAMGIGLHKEFPTWDASLLTLEMRRRVWYCLYIFDVGAIITFSRPLDFPEEGVDVRLPSNTHDSDITAGTRRMPPPAQETTIYTHLRAQAQFHLATSHIYSKIISHPLPPAAQLIDMDDQLIGGWLAELPPFFNETAIQPPKFTLCHAILRWRYRNFRILMYRPFLVGQLVSQLERGVDTTTTSDIHVGTAIDRCFRVAHEAVELITTFWRAHPEHRTMMACWYSLYFLFQAILIPVICLRNDPRSPLAEGWRGQILQAVEVLESMAVLNPTAQRCLGVIQSLCGNYLQPLGDGMGWVGPTEESPQTQLANLYPLMWPTLEMGMGQLDGADAIIQESTIMDFMNRLPILD